MLQLIIMIKKQIINRELHSQFEKNYIFLTTQDYSEQYSIVFANDSNADSILEAFIEPVFYNFFKSVFK